MFAFSDKVGMKSGIQIFPMLQLLRVRNLKFAIYLKFAASRNTNKINEVR